MEAGSQKYYFWLPALYIHGLLNIPTMENAKNACLQALKLFIEDSCNENKMELHIAYEDIDDSDKESVLGKALNLALSNIIHDNYHPDEYLQSLQKEFFS
jgi:hypothetical protein